MLSRLLGVLLLAAAWLSAGSVQALKFVPFVQEFAPRGANAKKAFRVENDGPEEIAVQVSMVRRIMALDGSEQLLDAEDDFIVFPPQMILKPGEERTIRVQWLGDPNPKAELAYRIIAEQLPIDLSSGQQTGSRVNLLIRYEGSVYIAPSGIASEVVVDTAAAHLDANGDKKLLLTLHNRGTAHALLRDLRLKFTSKRDSTSTTLPPERLDGIRGENMLAGNRRRFTLAWPQGVTFGAVAVEMTFTARR